MPITSSKDAKDLVVKVRNQLRRKYPTIDILGTMDYLERRGFEGVKLTDEEKAILKKAYDVK